MTHLDVMTLSQLLDGELEHAGPAEARIDFLRVFTESALAERND